MDIETGTGAEHMEGYLSLARSASGEKLNYVINAALKHPSIFVFGELLEIQSIKDLSSGSSSSKAAIDLLKIFAYGTYTDYKASKSALNLRDLEPAELTKLKQLTIVTRAATEKEVPYSSLLSELDLTNIRELEDLIIDCIYVGLISGSLDQKRSCLLVASAIGRDIGPNDVQNMIDQLDQWLSSCNSVVTCLDEGITEAKQSIAAAQQARDQVVEERKNTIEAIKLQRKEEQKAGGGGGGGGKKGGGGGGGPMGGMAAMLRGRN